MSKYQLAQLNIAELKAPLVACSTVARSRISPRTISSRGPADPANGRLFMLPVEKSSSTRTVASG